MDRRYFLTACSSSVAALLFLPPQSPAAAAIGPPDSIFIRLSEGWKQMVSSGNGEWNYRDAVVSLDAGTDQLRVMVHCPTQELFGIRIQWHCTLSSEGRCLGDQWERSYGDLRWRPLNSEGIAPWYLLIYDGKRSQCFGLKTGSNSLGYWRVTSNQIQLVLDTRSGGGGVELGNRRLCAAEVVAYQSPVGDSPFASAREFCRRMCKEPRLPNHPVYGINDWYFAYGNNSKDLILEHTALLSELASDADNLPYSVIDAGWAKKSPLAPDDCCWSDDFSQANEKFGDMGTLAGRIKALGMRPGLWFRPLSARHDDPPELLAPLIAGRNDPKAPILDPTIPENLQRIMNLVGLYRQWGYDLVKHDYSTYDIFGRWGFQMTDQLTADNWHFSDRTRTNAEIIISLYEAIRKAAQNTVLIGCNTMSHLSAGIFELNRIGDDTSGIEWSRTRKMGVNTLGFRLVQHKNFYLADGDCVGITDKIPWTKNEQWMGLLAESGAPLFVSAEPSAIANDQKKAIKNAFAHAAKIQPVGEPLDWLTNPLPKEWKLNGRKVFFDWA